MNALNTIGYVDSRTDEEKAAEPTAELTMTPAQTPPLVIEAAGASKDIFTYDTSNPVDSNIRPVPPAFLKNALMQKLAMLQHIRMGMKSEGRRSMLAAQRNAKVKKNRKRSAAAKASRKRNR